MRSVGRDKMMGAWTEAVTAVLERSTHRTPPRVLQGTLCPSKALAWIPKNPGFRSFLFIAKGVSSSFR